MARFWMNLVGVTPLLLGIVVSVPQMVVAAPLVLAQSSSQGSQPTEAQSLFNEGERLRRQGTRESLEQALAKFQQALLLFRTAGNSIEERQRQRFGEANTLNSLGGVYSAIGQPEQALEFYQQALLIYREVSSRAGEVNTLNSLGRIYSAIGQPERALSFYQQVLDFYQLALRFYREVGDRTGEETTLVNLAIIKRTLSNLPEALQNIQDAIAIVENIQGQVINPELRTSYLVSLQRYYKLQIDLLMELHPQYPDQNYAAQAFNVTERSKAITLLQLLTESQVDIRNGVDPQLLQQEQEIQSQLGAIDQRRTGLNSSTNKEDIAALEAQRAALQTQYRELQTKLRATSPKYAALKYPQTLTLAQVQQQILDDDTVILSYALGEERSYLWLISKTEMSSYELPSQKIIEDLVNRKARSQFTNRLTSRDRFLAETIDLSNILLKPILEKTSNKRLAIIGDGALQNISFGALPDPRVSDRYQPLLVNHEVVYLPSATTLQTIRNEAQARTPAPKTLAVLGDWDRLPGTRREANTILNLVPESNRLAYFDFPGDRENAQSNQLSQYRFIHWAIQGFTNTERPELSSIVSCLVDRNGARSNGNLLLADIFNLSFNADLVVLSACQTPLDGVGQGSIGLMRGVMYAGTPRVVTSLWDVPDSQTADLMAKFYEKMLQQNLRPAEALRAAQLDMFNSPRNWSPYNWAAFTLQGDWR